MILKCSYLSIFILLFASCKGQNQSDLSIDSTKVKEITITNKVFSNYRNYKPGKVVLTKGYEVENIIKSFKYLVPLKEKVNTKISNGFFEIDFFEDKINHYYTIHYTIYDGIIIRNDNTGEMFKDDRLEIAVYKHFVNW